MNRRSQRLEWVFTVKRWQLVVTVIVVTLIILIQIGASSL